MVVDLLKDMAINCKNKIDVPFKVSAAGKKTVDYFYLADLLQVNDDKEKNYKWYNNFLNELVINRTAHGIAIKHR